MKTIHFAFFVVCAGRRRFITREKAVDLPAYDDSPSGNEAKPRPPLLDHAELSSDSFDGNQQALYQQNIHLKHYLTAVLLLWQ